MLAVLRRPFDVPVTFDVPVSFDVPVPKDFTIIWFSNLLTLNIPHDVNKT